MSKYWMGSIPTKCDLCNEPITDRFYDVRLPLQGGMWANVDSACFVGSHAKLGIGRGQRYDKQPDGKFLCTAGSD